MPAHSSERVAKPLLQQSPMQPKIKIMNLFKKWYQVESHCQAQFVDGEGGSEAKKLGTQL